MTIDLDTLEATAKAATSGPWEVYGDSNIEGYEIEADNAYTKIVQGNVCKFEDAVYIAAANPAVVLELMARLKKAECARDRLAHWLESLARGNWGSDGKTAAEFIADAEKEISHE